MYKIDIFRNEDINIINKNINVIVDKAYRKKVNTIKPMIKEFIEIQTIILDFLKNNKNILYGGMAWDILIKNVNINDGIYSDIDMPDIDFYSNDPIKDLKKLCDILASKGYNYIQGKNAFHDESYKIFVNFTEYCNITYMPTHIYNNIQYVIVNGLKIIHPKIIMIDLFRQFNDPINSMWRLDKNWKRSSILLKYYNLEVTNKKYIKKKLSSKIILITKYILDYLSTNKNENIIFVDYNAMNIYLKPQVNIENQLYSFLNYNIEIISSNLENDSKDIYFQLQKYWADNNNFDNFNNDITIKEYYPYFQFLDHKIEYYYNNKLFLTIYGNNNYCYPYNNIQIKNNNNNNIMIGTFNLCIMYLLINNSLYFINKIKESQFENNYMLYKLITIKNNFLQKNKTTILDNNIYQDFKSECIGLTHNPLIKFMESISDSRKNKSIIPKSRIMPYDPNDSYNINSFKPENYYFNNTSGNLINNPNDLIIKFNQNNLLLN